MSHFASTNAKYLSRTMIYYSSETSKLIYTCMYLPPIKPPSQSSHPSKYVLGKFSFSPLTSSTTTPTPPLTTLLRPQLPILTHILLGIIAPAIPLTQLIRHPPVNRTQALIIKARVLGLVIRCGAAHDDGVGGVGDDACAGGGGG